MNNLRIFLLVSSVIVIALLAKPISIYAQQEINYVATLTGKDMVPPVNTPATGVARFHINPDGSLCYSVDVNHITGVLGAHIGTKNGTEVADLINPYATTSARPAYPTASVNGILTSGDIKAGIMRTHGKGGVLSPMGLVGPLIGKNVTDLDNILKSKDGYVTIRTVDHQRGEIQGQILPTSSTVNCVTTMRFAPPSTMPSHSSTSY